MGIGEFFTALNINPLYVMVYAWLFGIGSGLGSEIGKWLFKHFTKPHLEKTRHVTKKILAKEKET